MRERRSEPAELAETAVPSGEEAVVAVDVGVAFKAPWLLPASEEGAD
jgi:hypothetical protein